LRQRTISFSDRPSLARRATQARARARARTHPDDHEAAALGVEKEHPVLIPGLADRRPFTALVILAEIGDASRFGSARKLASWAGLTPTVRGSDRAVRHSGFEAATPSRPGRR
jgi:transposase